MAKLQFHLSGALLGMLVASELIFINVEPDLNEGRGFPYTFSSPRMAIPGVDWDRMNFAKDLMFGALFVIFVVLFFEGLIQNKGRFSRLLFCIVLFPFFLMLLCSTIFQWFPTEIGGMLGVYLLLLLGNMGIVYISWKVFMVLRKYAA